MRVLVILLAALPSAASAQASPTDVVRSFFDAYYAEDWDAAAALFHPGFALQFKPAYVENARRAAEYDGPTADDLMRQEPGLDRAVAECRARGIASTELLLSLDAPSLSVEDAESASDFQVLAASLRDSDFRTRLRDHLCRSADASEEQLPPGIREDTEELLHAKPELLGHHEEGDWAWVLYRSMLISPGPPQVPPATPDLIALRRHESGWRIWHQAAAVGQAITGYFLRQRR